MSAGKAQHSCHVAMTDTPWSSGGRPPRLSLASAELGPSTGT